MYFDLERLHGVPADEAAEAEQKADSLIEKYANSVGGVLDQQQVKRIVDEMYGSEKNYDWSQASVTTYFRTGKRNCDSIDRAQQIVFEGVIDRLPESERSRYELGETMLKKHVIATLTDRHGGDQTTFLLEPGLRTIRGGEAEVGTVNVTADFLKKSTVAPEIVAVAAVTGKPGAVAPSPDIDVLTNQPIPRGYITTGELKGAEFNYEQAQKDGLEPEPYVDTAVAPMEVEWIEGETTSQQADILFHQSLAESARILYPKNIDTSDLHQPSAKVIHQLGQKMQNEGVPHARVAGFKVTDIDHWSKEAVNELLLAPVDSLEIDARDVRPISLNHVFDAASLSQRMQMREIVLSGAEGTDARGVTQYQHFPVHEFYQLLFEFDAKNRLITIHYGVLNHWEWKAISAVEAKMIDLSRVRSFHSLLVYPEGSLDVAIDVTKVYADEATNRDVAKILRVLQDSGKNIIVDGVFFMNQALRDEKVLGYTKVIPSFEDIDRGQLAWFRSQLLLRHHPRVRSLVREIDDEIDLQNAREVQAHP